MTIEQLPNSQQGNAPCDLASGRCVPCEGGVPALGAFEASELHAQLKAEWMLSASVLQRSYRFTNFRNAFAFATKVALLAESQGHHPDLTIGWDHVDIALTTHAIGGLSNNDFVLAAKIDKFSN